MESKFHYRDSLCVRHGQEYFFFIIQMFQPMRNMTGRSGNVIRDANFAATNAEASATRSSSPRAPTVPNCFLT